MHEVLVNCLVNLAQEKSVVRQTDRLDMTIAVVICVFYVLVFVMLSRLFIAALWSPEEKGLTSWLWFVMFIVIL